MKSIIAILKNKPCFQGFMAANVEDISKTEKCLSLLFAKEYKVYLMEFGFATYEGHELTGICKSKRLNVSDVTIMERKLNTKIPDDWYVIEQLNIDGIVIWQASDGAIYQTSPYKEPVKICDSLAEYIEQE